MLNFKDNSQIPLGVCWNITSRCNSTCRFCYRSKTRKELPITNNLYILRMIIKKGIRKISWTGGEPTLYPDLISIVTEAKNSGVITSITTNATHISELFLKENNNLFDWISLPLDAVSSPIQELLGRSEKHVDRVLSLLEFLSNKSRSKLKINTIVTKCNLEYIKEIPRIFSNYNVTRWKIFRFLPSRGVAYLNRKYFQLSDFEFSKIIFDIREISKKYPRLEVSVIDKKDYMDSHLSIEPNGDVQKFINNSYHLCGNLVLENIDKVLIETAVNNNAIIKRYKNILESKYY